MMTNAARTLTVRGHDDPSSRRPTGVDQFCLAAMVWFWKAPKVEDRDGKGTHVEQGSINAFLVMGNLNLRSDC
jgi:hypothetical protein